jgi:hypothetical protein
VPGIATLANHAASKAPFSRAPPMLILFP